jgi:hypothetical protein
MQPQRWEIVMLKTDTIREFDPGLPAVYGFRILDAVTADDMAQMGRRMNDVFDAAAHKVDMLLVFETEREAQAGAGFSKDAITSQFKSLSNVGNYVVANAPAQAGSLVETMGKAIPEETRAFDTKAEATGWLKRHGTMAA